MTNLSSEEIRRKIRDLEDKIHDCKAYISSDFCISCNEMYNNIKKYEEEIRTLKDYLSINND